MPKARGIIQPNLGVQLDRPPISVDPRAMSDCMNVRVKNGRVTNANLGYTKFFSQQLNGPVLLIDNFFLRTGAQLLVFATDKDIYQYDEVNDDVQYLTPRYETGTIGVTAGSTAVTGAGTLWDTNDNLKAGDNINAGGTAVRDPGDRNGAAYSEVFSNSRWIVSNTNVVDNDAVAPDGTTTADKLREDSDVSQVHQLWQTFNVTTGIQYTISIFAKAAEIDWVQLSMNTAGFPASASANFDLTLGTVLAEGAGIDSSTMTNEGGGWYRISITATCDASVDTPTLALRLRQESAYNGDGVSGIHIWGAQIEENSVPSGYERVTDPWYEIASITDDTNLVLVRKYNEATGSGKAYTGRQLFQGDIFDYWRTETFPDAQPSGDDHWYATNGGTDYPVRWNGTDTQVTVLDTIGFKCKELARYKNMLIYINLIMDSGEARPFSIRNSAITEPENVITLEAAEFVVHDGVDPLVGAMPFGDNLFIYAERSVITVQFVGTPFLFAFRTGISGLGPFNGRMVADFGDFHTFLSADSLYRFDGIGIESINGHVWLSALRTQDPKRLDLAFSHFDEENGELHWILPRTTDADTIDGQPETSYVEHYLEDVGERQPNPHTIRSMPFTSAGFFERLSTLTWNAIITDWTAQNFAWNDSFLQSAFPFNLFGDEDGFIYILNNGETADGVAQVNFARFGRRLLGDGKSKGLLKRVYGYFEPLPSAGYGVDVTVRSVDSLGGKVTVNAPLVHDITHANELDFFVSPFVVARAVDIEFGTDGTNEPWTLQGYDVDVAPAGKA